MGEQNVNMSPREIDNIKYVYEILKTDANETGAYWQTSLMKADK